MTTDQSKPTTTDAGIPVESDEHSLTVGPGGPILLQDSYLIEQMAQFNRERIPERQPHARERRIRPVRGDERRQPVHQGGRVPARRHNPPGRSVLHRGGERGSPDTA